MRTHAQDGSRGFSLIELLVVVGIIAIGAAMATPAIGRYFRNYRIREAQSQVAGAIQAARTRAITKNVNHGVAFVIQSKTRYWVHVEDDLSTARATTVQVLDFAAPVAIQSTSYDLPRGVEFVDSTSAGNCRSVGTVRDDTTAFAPTGGWFGFTRLGGWCNTSPCATPTKSGITLPNTIMHDATGSLVCVLETNTGLSRALQVSPGGRVRTTR